MRLVPNSVIVITETAITKRQQLEWLITAEHFLKQIFCHTKKTTSAGGRYYDVATTALIVTWYGNQVYEESDKYCQVIRITIDGLNTKIKFFSVKEKVDGTVLTVSMKSTGTHRECVALGALLA